MVNMVKQNDSTQTAEAVVDHYRSPIIQGDRKQMLPWAHSRLSYQCDQILIKNWRYGWTGSGYGYKEPSVTDTRNMAFLPGGLSFFTNRFVSVSNGVLYTQINTRNEATTKALADLNQQKWKVGTLLAELHGTTKYLAGVSTSMAVALRAIRDPKWYFRNKRVRKRLRDKLGLNHYAFRPKKLSDRWLESQFAIAPLYEDIVKSVEFFKTQFKGIDFSFVSVKRTAKSDLPLNFYEEDSNFASRYRSYHKRDGYGQYTATAKYFARVTDQAMIALKGFQLDTPTVGWQAVPFSWLVDSFVPISTFFEALSGPKGLTFVDGYISEKTTLTQYIEKREGTTDAFNDPWGHARVYDKLYKGRLNYAGYHRVVIEDFPNVRPYFRFDQGAWNIVTLSALILSTKGGSGNYAAKF